MGDVGTITEIEPEDGLGWIEMPSGERVRFGGTACKGFVPAIGMKVRVTGTKPGYGGTVKATGLERVADAPRELRKGSASQSIPVPRQSLLTVQNAGVPADDLLLKLLGRADVDDALHADLKAASFSVNPRPGTELGCTNPWFYAVADLADGASAYGLYAHPMFEAQPARPWVLWRPETRALRYVGLDTAQLLPRVLATATAEGVDAAAVHRLQTDLVKLGMPSEPGAPITVGERVDWLPPEPSELRPVDAYLQESDGGEMERGLLAHAYATPPDPRAAEALRSLYATWEWALPAWGD